MNLSLSRPWRLGVDIGGTFTDIVLSERSGHTMISKVSTTPEDPSRAVISGVRQMLQENGVAPELIREVIHGTTAGSNAILQRKGARTGLLTTKGFRDVLEIGRIRTPVMFDLSWSKPEPLVQRRHCFELSERVLANGTVERGVSRSEIEKIAEDIHANDIAAVAVCFINSYRNTDNEQLAASMLRELCPHVKVTASHEILQEIMEYERTSTTVVNAYLLPEIESYVVNLIRDMRGLGIDAPIQIVASNGGMIGAETAMKAPVFTVASGPAGGVAGAAAIAKSMGHDDVIVFDMGGTTAKASIIENGMPDVVTEYEFREGISSPSRFVKGGGYMLKVPAVDIAEVGAGGGSIAGVDAGGLLAVGPASAGSMPGPACYDLGNKLPTVTDANVILGMIGESSLAGGALTIKPQLAEEALQEHIGKPLGMSVNDAARGVREIANLNMARAIRAVTIERGRDPRNMIMMAFGGGGPLHAVDLARRLGVSTVIAPVMSGVFAAAGMLTADVEYNFSRQLIMRLEDADPAVLKQIIAELRVQGTDALAREGYEGSGVGERLYAGLRYVGQTSEILVPIEDEEADFADVSRLNERYERDYYRTYGYATNEGVEISSLRLSAIGMSSERLDFARVSLPVSDRGDDAAKKYRDVSFEGVSTPVRTEIIARSDVGQEQRQGPCIIEAYDTTIVIPPDCTFRADAVGNVLITLGS